jgi:hypothetical protein
MNASITTRRLAASLLAILASQAAIAQQRLPDPPPAQGEGTPMPEKALNMGDFLSAYKRAGTPRLLIYSDLVGTSAGGAKTLNDMGTITHLGARLEDLFRDPEVIIVSPGAAETLNEQQMEAMRRSGSYEAARTLGKAANADVVLYLRLIEQAGTTASYTGTYVLADLRRGTTLGRFSWDMVPGPGGEFDAARMTEYARAIARRAIDQFVEAFPAGGNMANARRFTVRVVGDYLADDLAGLRDALNASTGVKPGSVLVRSEDKTETTNVATLELAYTGEMLDLRRLVRRAVVDQMGMEAGLIDAREGSIGLKLAPLALGARERLLTGGARTNRNGAERDRLKLAYANAKRPTIAVMFNKPTVETDQPIVPSAASEGVSVLIGERVNVDAGGVSSGFTDRLLERELRDQRGERRQAAAIDLRVFEDKVCERLLQLGLQPRDLSQAQVGLSTAPEFKDRAWTDRELAFALGKAANADIVISGVGQVTRKGDEPQRVVLTMRAFEVATGDVVGAASVERSVAGGGEPFGQAIEELSAEAVGKLVVQMADRWEGMERK